MISVQVSYSGQARALAGTSAEPIGIAQPHTVTGLLHEIARRHEPLRALLFNGTSAPRAGLLIFVDDEQSDAETMLHDGCNVDIVPPISGG